jgi:hypothetical protein
VVAEASLGLRPDVRIPNAKIGHVNFIDIALPPSGKFLMKLLSTVLERTLMWG